MNPENRTRWLLRVEIIAGGALGLSLLGAIGLLIAAIAGDNGAIKERADGLILPVKLCAAFAVGAFVVCAASAIARRALARSSL